MLGGGFAGAYVARLLGKRGATIVSPENSMLYTPLLPEAASGTLEPRHVVVPLRQMCPHAELVLGRATSLDAGARTVAADTIAGPAEISYDRLVVALGAVDARLSRARARRARPRLQGSRRRDRAPQPRPAAARGCRGGRPALGARLRLRGSGLRGRRGARGAQRSRAGGPALLPGAARHATAVGARRCGSGDPARGPTASRGVRSAPARAPRNRDPRRRDAGVLRRRNGRSLERDRRAQPAPWSGRPV